MQSPPGGDARAKAISRLAASSAETAAWPLPWRKRRNQGTGQSVQVRVQGRRQCNVCGPDEVDLVTTARGEPLVGTPTGSQ